MAVSIQTLRDEGVLDVGAVDGTSFVYVTTRARTIFFHAAELPRRHLDTYGAHRAVYWIEERGVSSFRYAARIGVADAELRRALLSIGYARLDAGQHAQLEAARSSRKIGNRRGPLVRIEETSARSTSVDPMSCRPRNPAFNGKSFESKVTRKRSLTSATSTRKLTTLQRAR